MPPFKSKVPKPANRSAVTSETQRGRDRTPAFVYPSLHPLESWIYWLLLMSCQVYAYYAVFTASTKYREYRPSRLSQSPYQRWFSSGNGSSGIFGKLKNEALMDLTNWEWQHWTRNYLPTFLPWFIGHTFVFNGSHKFLKPFTAKTVCILYWLAAAYYGTSLKTIFLLLSEMLAIYTLSFLLRNLVVVWGCVGFVLYQYTHTTSFWKTYIGDLGVDDDLCEIQVVTYTQLQIISFCIEMTRRDKGKFWSGFHEMTFYSWYLPYASNVVRIYPEFEREMKERSSRAFDLRGSLFFGCRVFFWILVTELSLNFVYSEAMQTDPHFLKIVSIDQLISIGYLTLHFFHLKYVGIFGICQFFAKMDNMQPTTLPICPGHVNTYMKTWRYFDVGLYDFFKTYIYIPICTPTFSFPRKLIGFVVCYLFVLTWHGFKHQYIIWVALTMLEIVSVVLSRGMYIAYFKQWREKTIPDLLFRRILAFGQIWTITVGCYACFYFLGGSASGWVFADRVFWGMTLPPTWQVYLMFCYGYLFNQCCMDCCIYEDRKAAKKKAE